MLDCFPGAGGDLGGVLDTGGGVDVTGDTGAVLTGQLHVTLPDAGGVLVLVLEQAKKM